MTDNINHMDKKGVSNQVLLTLAVLALIISVGGALISMNKLKTLEVTGFVAVGSVNATVGGATTITLKVNGVNFTNEAAGNTNDTCDRKPVPFNLSNDGNVCVNVTIARDNVGWFIGTMDYDGTTANSNNTQFNVSCRATDCKTGTLQGTGWYNLSTTATLGIATLNATTGNNSAEIHVRIHVPADEIAGTKTSIVTFTSSDAGYAGCTTLG